MSMPDSCPSFETDRLLIRPRCLADLEACLDMDRDPEVTRFVPGPWFDPAAHRTFVLERMTVHYPLGFGYWAVTYPDDPHRLLGWVLLLPGEQGSQNAEIGWRFVRNCWGMGYATEAARAVLAHAHDHPEIQCVFAEIDPRNKGSIGVAEKLGMRTCPNFRTEQSDGIAYRINTGNETFAKIPQR